MLLGRLREYLERKKRHKSWEMSYALAKSIFLLTLSEAIRLSATKILWGVPTEDMPIDAENSVKPHTPRKFDSDTLIEPGMSEEMKAMMRQTASLRVQVPNCEIPVWYCIDKCWRRDFGPPGYLRSFMFLAAEEVLRNDAAYDRAKNRRILNLDSHAIPFPTPECGVTERSPQIRAEVDFDLIQLETGAILVDLKQVKQLTS
jgi:hypothetical protein